MIKRLILLATIIIFVSCITYRNNNTQSEQQKQPDIAQKALDINSTEIPRQGEYGEMTKWYKYSYEIRNPYPYVKYLPSADKIPDIIATLEKRDGDDSIPSSQLSCLTRMSFDRHDNSRTAFDKPKAWHDWWETVGKDYFSRVEKEGKSNPEAWKLLVGDALIPCPNYAILIPKEWHFEINFRSGDYGGVQREVISMERTVNGAILKRHYSINSTAPFQYEVWHGFTPQEADKFLYGLGYAIDHPWFVKQFICIPKRQNNTDLVFSNDSHPGRRWGNYCAGVEWSGILLPDNRVWWNDDPWTWHSTGVKREFEDISLDAGCRLVYPFVCYHFPEKRSVAGSVGWEPDPNPPPFQDQPKNDWAK